MSIQVNGRFLGFHKELAGAADTEAVIGSLRRFADGDGIFDNDILVGFREPLLIVNVPSKSLEERVNEFQPYLCLFVLSGYNGGLSNR